MTAENGKRSTVLKSIARHGWKAYVAIALLLLAIAAALMLFFAEDGSGVPSRPAQEKSVPYAQLIGDAPTIGPADAKVTIIVYSDLFCPHCLVLDEDAIEPILQKYKGRIRFAAVQVNVLMNMGYASTNAAYCAEEQGKFWQMRKVLLERTRPFVGRAKTQALLDDMQKASALGTPEYLTRLAGTVDGIDTGRFLQCVKADKYGERIARSNAIFSSLGLPGVPVVLINGRPFTEIPTEENLSRAIDDAL